MTYDKNYERVYVIWSKYYSFVNDFSLFTDYYGNIFREVDEHYFPLLTYYMTIDNQQAVHILEFNTNVFTR